MEISLLQLSHKTIGVHATYSTSCPLFSPALISLHHVRPNRSLGGSSPASRLLEDMGESQEQTWMVVF